MTGKLHFEDFAPGDTMSYGSRAVSREDIVGFAAEYDPQPMHLDEAAAAQTMLGGLAASGWHVCSLLMRMIADGFVLNSTGMGSGGVDEVKWLKPVRAGDVLSVRHTVLDVRPSKTKTDRGFVRFRFEMTNAKGEVVLEQTNSIIFGRRHPGEAA